jgi:hypothetical protein
MCMDKFMGKPKGQKAAATVERDDGEPELSPDEVFEESEEESVVATTLTLARLVEQQKALADQIAALREKDF